MVLLYIAGSERTPKTPAELEERKKINAETEELKPKNWLEIWEYEASGAHAVDLEWQPVFSQGKVLFLPMDASQLLQT